MEAYWGNSRQARVDARAALRLPPTRYGQIYAAFALALAGDSTQAGKLAAEVSKEWPLDAGLQYYWLPTVRAAVALDRKNADRAVEILQSLSARELGTMTRLEPIYVRGQAHLMQRNGGAAAREFQKIIDHPGIVGTLSIGALAHLGLARAYALQGDTAKSRAAYQDFLMLWKDADPEIPVLKEAKAEFAKLQ
jgi:predicted Zn-dependent protease